MTINQQSAEKNTEVRRTDIQKVVAPAVEAALPNIAKLDLSRSEDQRRFFRAVVHFAAGKLLDSGVLPEVLLHSAAEAIAKEVEARGISTSDDSESESVNGFPNDAFFQTIAQA